MKDSAFRIHQGEWGISEKSVKNFSEEKNNGMIKSRFGLIYFIVLVSSLLIFFAR